MAALTTSWTACLIWRPRGSMRAFSCCAKGEAGSWPLALDLQAPSGPAHAPSLPLRGSSPATSNWRCLEADCGSDSPCVCLPPPLPAEATAYVLTGLKNGGICGEKRLRAALVRTVEWRTAAVAALVDQPELADIVTSRDSSRLRKPHFLSLCWHWRYASPYWTPRTRPPPRPAVATPPTAPAQLALRTSPPRSPSSDLEAFRLALSSVVSAFTGADIGFSLFRAAGAEPLAPLTLLNPDVLLQVISTGLQRVERMRADAARLNRLACEEEEGLGADPQCAHHCPESEVADSHLAVVRHLLIANEAGLAAVSPQHLEVLSAPDKAHVSDVRAAIAPMYVLAVRAQAELDNVRRCELARNLQLRAAAEVCSVVAEVHATIARRCEARAALSVARMSSGAAGGGAEVSPHLQRMIEETVRLSVPYEKPDFFSGLMRAARISA